MHKIDLLVNNDEMNVDIKDMFYYLSDANDIYVRGKICAKDGYMDLNKTDLIIKGDILDREGNILLTIKDWTSKIIKPHIYDLFDLSCCAIHRFIDIHSIAAIKIYPVYEEEMA